MSTLADTLARAARDLDALGVRWALVGGLAVSARAEPRLTKDVDLAVAVSGDPAAEALVHALVLRGWRVAVVLEHVTTGRLATARLVPAPPATPVVVDLLFAATGIEPEIVQTATPIEALPGLVVPVASVADLLAMKLLARADRSRASDEEDERALVARASAADLAQTEARLMRMRELGTDRGYDLLAGLARARSLATSGHS